MLRNLIAKLGIPVYSPNVRWPDDNAFNDVRRRAKARGVEGNEDDRCYTLFKAAQSVAKLEGELAECGCGKGKSTRFILAGTGIESDKKIHIFDSFEDFDDKIPNAKMNTGNTTFREGGNATGEDLLVSNAQMYEQMLSIHTGKIPTRFDDVKDKTFSLLHIDIDQYDPVYDSLSFFYSRMVKGAVIVSDDYGSVSGGGARRAFDEFFADKPETVFELPTAQAMVVKG